MWRRAAAKMIEESALREAASHDRRAVRTRRSQERADRRRAVIAGLGIAAHAR
jgi:hypothetical protein